MSREELEAATAAAELEAVARGRSRDDGPVAEDSNEFFGVTASFKHMFKVRSLRIRMHCVCVLLYDRCMGHSRSWH